jgi:hypothetical protein
MEETTMLRLRFLGIAVLAALVLGVIGASSASATFKLEPVACDKGKPAICWDVENGTKLQELVGVETFTIEQLGKGLLESIVGGQKFHIECEKAKVKKGEIFQNEPLLKVTTLTMTGIDFENCTELTPANCSIEKTLTTEGITGEATTTTDVIFKPTNAALPFIEINVKGEKCPIIGLIPVSGFAEGLWEKEINIDLAEHLMEFIHTDPGLKIGKEKAGLESDIDVKIPLLGDAWDVVEA